MKDINKFTSEILEEVNKKRRRKRILVTSIISFLLVFIIAYSNIIPSRPFDLFEMVYEAYAGVYVNDEEETAFSFTNGSNAFFSIDSIPYALETESNFGKKFNFNATKMNSSGTFDSGEIGVETYSVKQENYLDETKIKVVFNDGGATISGNIYGEYISIEVKLVENTVLEQGLWRSFDKNYPNYTLSSYIFVGENEESYYIRSEAKCLEMVFISVNGKEFILLMDAFSVPYEFVSIEKIEKEVYGFNAFKVVSYSGNEDIYFKLLKEEELIDYQGGEFFAKYIKEKKEIYHVGRVGELDVLPIRWKLFPEKEYENKRLDITARLDLKSDKTVALTIYDKGTRKTVFGKWVPTDENLIVILKDNSIFGKVFVITNQKKNKNISENAISDVQLDDVFKTGFHNFDYYLKTTYYKIFWGSAFTEDVFSNELKYGVEYVLDGYYYKWCYDNSLPFSYDTEILPQDGKLKIVVEQDMVKVYEDELIAEVKYTLEDEGGGRINLRFKYGIIIKINDENTTLIRTLYYRDGRFLAPNLTTVTQHGQISNFSINFIIAN